MENKINIAELLKDCPKGMELDCTMYEDVEFLCVTHDTDYPIQVLVKDPIRNNKIMVLTKEGHFERSYPGKCVIFPKGKTTWDGFVPPCKFKDGDIVACGREYEDLQLFILKKQINDKIALCYVCFDVFNNVLDFKEKSYFVHRYATEEEKQKLFDALKSNGYKWNAETKTLEKIIKPKFKVGDTIQYKDYYDTPIVTIKSVLADRYILNDDTYIEFCNQDNYTLLKFDINNLVPFESKVLVRNVNKQVWIPAFWGGKQKDGYVTTFGWSQYCIPYEGNEHLLGKTNDCADFYKTWEE